MQARALFLLLVPAVLCVRTPFSGMQRDGVDSEEWVKPWFCHGNECPKYKVINTTATYEVRKYAPGKWVSTDCLETHFMNAQYAGFYRLYKYITGANEANATIPMTAPVMNYVSPGLMPTALSNITVSFYLPYNFQKVDPPAPTGPNIYIQDLPEMKVYVASFGGWAKGSTVSAQVEALQAAMEAEEVAYDKEHYFFAGYDPPFRFFDRHNEVWVQALKEEPTPSPSPSPPDVPPEPYQTLASSSEEESHVDTVKVPVS